MFSNLFKNHKLSLLLLISSGLLIIGSVIITPHGDFREAEAFNHFWLGISIMCAGFMLSWQLKSINFTWFWLIAIVTRILLLAMYPGSDIWRYLWEGYIQNLGFSPYHLAPNAIELEPYRTLWWSQINHQEVSAIYPPLTQFGFRLLAYISPSVLWFKIAFVIADLITCWLLTQIVSFHKASLYAWNPLVIYSFAGGGHYDSWFILPLVAAWIVFDYGKQYWRWLVSALLVGISIAIKWISLPILAFLVWRSWREVNFKMALLIILVAILPFFIVAIPFCDANACPLIPVSSNFVTQGRSAEFFPYLLAQVLPFTQQANWYFVIPLSLTLIWLLYQAQNFQQFAQGYFFLLLIISPIIHAWYLTWIIPFAVVSQNLGVRLISISAFIYFVLFERMASGIYDWYLSFAERMILWLPFIFGWWWHNSRLTLTRLKG